MVDNSKFNNAILSNTEYIDLHEMVIKGQQREIIENTSNDIYVHFLNVIILRNSGMFEKGIDYLKSHIDTKELITPEINIMYKMTYGSTSINLGDIKTVGECVETGLEILNENSSFDKLTNIWISDFYLLAGRYNFGNKQYDLAEKYMLEALNFEFPERLKLYQNTKVKNNLSITYMDTGRFHEALKLLEETHKIWADLGNIFAYAHAIGNIGRVYSSQGNYDLAYAYFLEANKTFMKIGNPSMLLVNYIDLAIVNYDIGNISIARQYYEIGSQLLDEHKVWGTYIARFFYHHIKGELHCGDLNNAIAIMEKFNEIVIEKEELIIYKQLTNAMISFYDKDIRESSKDTFEQLLERKTADKQITSEAKIYLISYYLGKFHESNDMHFLNQAENYLQVLEQYALSENRNILMIKSLIMRAQIRILAGDRKDALVFIDDAYKRSEELELFFLSVLISSIYDKYFIEDSTDLVEEDFLTSGFNNYLENDLAVCIFQLTDTDEIEMLAELESDSTSFKNTILSILEHIHDEFKKSKESFIFRYIFQEYKAIIITDRTPRLGYLFRGDSYSALRKLQSFYDMYKLTLKNSKIQYPLKITKRENFQDLAKSINNPNEEIFDGLVFDLRSNLAQYKIFLNPLRMTIMKYMMVLYKVSRTKLEKAIGGKRGTFDTHLRKLVSENILEFEIKFVNEKSRTFVSLTIEGEKLFKQFSSELMKIIA